MENGHMNILYGYTKYDTPRKGIFKVEANEYVLSIGWLQKEEEETIIGETDDSYVYQLKESEHGEWVGNKVIKHRYILPLGIHKSRLARWTSGQLTLFDKII